MLNKQKKKLTLRKREKKKPTCLKKKEHILNTLGTLTNQIHKKQKNLIHVENNIMLSLIN